MAHVEYRKFGPPGTGKTTSLARDVRHAAEKFGASAIVVASFSRSAATELLSRGLPIPEDRVGTLHSLAYRAIGRSQKVLGKHEIEEWNRANPAQPMSPDSYGSDADGRPAGSLEGDNIRERYDTLRSLCRARDLWPGDVRAFAAKWERFKAESDCIDFVDMIHLALDNTTLPHGRPYVGFFDECQDMSTLEWRLVRHWAESMEYVVCVGDDDQTIYSWRGADAQSFLTPALGDEYVRVLSQSYRVPGAVHQIASRWISQIRRRQPKQYMPRRDESGTVVPGSVSRPGATHGDGYVADIAQRAAKSGTVAVLTAANYMLGTVIGELRRQYVPFHNPWRRHEKRWNPLGAVARGQVSASDRIAAWLGPSVRADGTAWSLEELQRWSSVVSAGAALARGAKAEIARADSEPTYADLSRWVLPETFAAGAAGDLEYLLSHATASARKPLEYPAGVVRRRGYEALTTEPRIIVSTIHASKGGEADTVILAPDLSYAGYLSYLEDPDPTVRQFYVGLTRAREGVILLDPVKRRLAVDL